MATKKIMFITSSIPENSNDWKSVFIADMLLALSRTSNLLYWGPDGVVPKTVKNVVDPTSKNKLADMSEIGGIATIIRSGKIHQKLFYPLMLLVGIRKSAKMNRTNFDVYLVNWLQNALSIPNDGKELYITVLGSDLGLLKFTIIRFFLLRIFKKHHTVLLPNAAWMIKPLTEYFGDLVAIKVTPLGIREYWFNEVERKPHHWMSVSRVTHPKVKRLFEWGKNLFSEDNPLLLVGPNQDNLPIPEWVNYAGETNLDGLLNIYYPQAQALIFLSEHHEGRPQTIIEAMASGVPVLCLDNELYREFISDGENGFLVSTLAELESALLQLSDAEINKNISRAARLSIKILIGTWDDYANKIDRLMMNHPS